MRLRVYGCVPEFGNIGMECNMNRITTTIFIIIPRHVLIYLYLFALFVRCIRELHEYNVWLVSAIHVKF